MKNLIFLFVLVMLIPFWKCAGGSTDRAGSVNPIIGDIGYFHKFGHMPLPESDEDTRVRTHLEYAEQLLRAVNVDHLSNDLRGQRIRVLDLLNEYWSAGIFPRNHAFEGVRVPCFIDDNGRICAVGYLVEQTAGRMVAERINALHQYDEIRAMDDAALHDWIAQSGFTREEIAMIQPRYGYHPGRVSGLTVLATFGSTLGNTTLNTMNIISLAKGDTDPARHRHLGGMLMGGGQLALGIASNPNAIGTRRDFSLFNIGVGATTMVTTYLDIRMKRRNREDGIQPFVLSYSGPGGKAAFGFHLTKVF